MLILGIATVQIVGLQTYRASLSADLSDATERRLADRLLTIKRTLTGLPEELREDAAHDLSSGAIEAHWSPDERAVEADGTNALWVDLQARLIELAPELAEGGLIVGAQGGESPDPHVALISMRLVDGTWLNVSLLSWTPRIPGAPQTVMVAWMIAAVALATAVLLVRWISRPLGRFAEAANGFYTTGRVAAVPETGPYEVAVLARAFNDLQDRLARSIEDRTQALAAVSHDLKTPITRLRLRAEEIDSDPLARSIAHDLDEMERMIDQTLSYLHGDRSDEPMRPVDLVAILETVTDDLSDQGGVVTLQGPRAAVISGRRLGLKRAFANLVGNAVKYGGTARVSVAENAAQVTVTIDDDGEGIAPADRERVRLPFVRLESSRNSTTGGFGLGLTIAGAVIDGHGGTLDLDSAPSGGLRVSVTLPKPAA
ncbi:ATP-binding protein [Tabrizicola sp. M-4]|uniref:ATP-binding protein n=1 Tax=Tabrizicola sp. M-4 TaxID=3055847 RepID=UPI003DA8054A